MGEGTKVTLSGVLLLAAVLIGIYGMWSASFGNQVYGTLLTSAFIASVVVPRRHLLLQSAVLLALVLLAVLFGHIWYDRLWALMTVEDRTVTSLAIISIAGLAVLVRLTWQFMNWAIARQNAAEGIATWPK